MRTGYDIYLMAGHQTWSAKAFLPMAYRILMILEFSNLAAQLKLMAMHQDTPNRLEYCAFVPAPLDKKCGNSDNIHFSAIGSRIIGRNAAMAFDEALKNNLTLND